MQIGPTPDVKGLKLRIGVIAGWLIRMTPPCDQVVKLVSEGMDHPLPLRTRLSIRFHFLICKWCERYRQQLIFVQRAMRRHPDKLEGQDQPAAPALSPEARERLKQALRRPQAQ